MKNALFFCLVGLTIVCFLIFFRRVGQMGDRSFPTSEYIQGFAKVKGVPNKGGKSYFSSTDEAIRRCRDNPFCIGVSNQRLFLVEKEELKKGETVFTEKGQSGESHAYVKDAYPTVFL